MARVIYNFPQMVNPTGPRRGRPRKAEQIFTAALQLLADNGYEGLTIEAIAAAAGVNKTTIYRWWPSKDALLADALTDAQALTVEMPDTGSLRADLLVLAGHISTLLTTNLPVATAIFGAAQRRPELAALLHRFFADRLASEQPIFARAVARGELPADADPELIMDLLAGAIWCRLLLRGGTLAPGRPAELVDLILRGAAG